MVVVEVIAVSHAGWKEYLSIDQLSDIQIKNVRVTRNKRLSYYFYESCILVGFLSRKYAWRNSATLILCSNEVTTTTVSDPLIRNMPHIANLSQLAVAPVASRVHCIDCISMYCGIGPSRFYLLGRKAAVNQHKKVKFVHNK